MAARRKEPEIFIEGIDVVIRLDLGKHRVVLAQTQAELIAFRDAREHESAKKRHYFRLIGTGKYDDAALERSLVDIRVNIRHMSDKVKAAEEKVQHHSLIVDTLALQLLEYERKYASLHR